MNTHRLRTVDCRLWIFLLCAFALNAFGQTVVFFTNSADTTLTVKAVNNPILFNGNFHTFPKDGTNVAIVGGEGSNSLWPGKYTCSFAGIPQSFTITVTNSLTALNAADLTDPKSIVIYSGVQTLMGTGGIAIVPPTGGGGQWTIDGSGIAGGSGSGNVRGPVSSQLHHLPSFADTSGQLLEDSGIPFANVALNSYVAGVSNLWNSGSNNLNSAIAANTTAIGGVQTFAIAVSNLWNTGSNALAGLLSGAGSGNVVGSGATVSGNFAEFNNTSATGIGDSGKNAASFDVSGASLAATNGLFTVVTNIAPGGPDTNVYAVLGSHALDLLHSNENYFPGNNTNAGFSHAYVLSGVNNSMRNDGSLPAFFEMHGSVIVAGEANINWGSDFCVIAGGMGNFQDSSYSGSSIGGGFENNIGGNYATIGGGFQNAAAYLTTVDGATVGGGVQNDAQGAYSTVPGGFQNKASGSGGFAAGKNSTNVNDGSFVWSDSQTPETDTAQDQFRASAHGGFFFDKGATHVTAVVIDQWLITTNANHTIIRSNLVYGGWDSLTTNGVYSINGTPLIDGSTLVANAHVKTGSLTNFISSEDATGYTNTISWTHEGTATNLTANFNGTRQTFTVTNGPTLFVGYAGQNGSCSYQIKTNVALVFKGYQPTWLYGSNAIATNAILVLTSFGGTNASQIEATLVEH